MEEEENNEKEDISQINSSLNISDLCDETLLQCFDEPFDLEVDGTKLRTDDQYFGFDNNVGNTWIYPSNYPIRTYQFNISQAALFRNTLVVLPTGLGKTFIAAVVMYNMYRWYPRGKIIFMAPTRPLVTQQIEACYNIMGISKNDTVELTGKTVKEKRKILWKKKRVFFVTPQVVLYDLYDPEMDFPINDVKLIVIDEAHRAKGKYAYADVVRIIYGRNPMLRILALSATPGHQIYDVVEVVKNLYISHIEVRWENSIDVQQFTFKKNIKTVVVPLGNELNSIRDDYIQIIDPYIRYLIDNNVFSVCVRNLTKGWLILEKKRFFEQSLVKQHPKHSTILDYLSTSISLYHGLELLDRHGLITFLNFFENPNNFTNEKYFVSIDLKLKDFVDKLRQYIGPNPYLINDMTLPNGQIENIPNDLDFGHPKFEILRKHILEHFTDNEDSRAIIFCEYRESVYLIHKMLLQNRPLIKPKSFVGQSPDVTQKQQISIMENFRNGTINTLIATCVAEEGIDVGEVDLIICFDINTRNPMRFIQRIGRTGRKRNGKVIVLVTEGKEHELLKDVLGTREKTNQKLAKSAEILKALYKTAPRMVPPEFNPKCVQTFIKINNNIELPVSPEAGTSIKKITSKKKTSSATRTIRTTSNRSCKKQNNPIGLRTKDVRSYFKPIELDIDETDVFCHPLNSSTRNKQNSSTSAIIDDTDLEITNHPIPLNENRTALDGFLDKLNSLSHQKDLKKLKPMKKLTIKTIIKSDKYSKLFKKIALLDNLDFIEQLLDTNNEKGNQKKADISEYKHILNDIYSNEKNYLDNFKKNIESNKIKIENMKKLNIKHINLFEVKLNDTDDTENDEEENARFLYLQQPLDHIIDKPSKLSTDSEDKTYLNEENTVEFEPFEYPPLSQQLINDDGKILCSTPKLISNNCNNNEKSFNSNICETELKSNTDIDFNDLLKFFHLKDIDDIFSDDREITHVDSVDVTIGENSTLLTSLKKLNESIRHMGSLNQDNKMSRMKTTHASDTFSHQSSSKDLNKLYNQSTKTNTNAGTLLSVSQILKDLESNNNSNINDQLIADDVTHISPSFNSTKSFNIGDIDEIFWSSDEDCKTLKTIDTCNADLPSSHYVSNVICEKNNNVIDINTKKQLLNNKTEQNSNNPIEKENNFIYSLDDSDDDIILCSQILPKKRLNLEKGCQKDKHSDTKKLPDLNISLNTAFTEPISTDQIQLSNNDHNTILTSSSDPFETPFSQRRSLNDAFVTENTIFEDSNDVTIMETELTSAKLSNQVSSHSIYKQRNKDHESKQVLESNRNYSMSNNKTLVDINKSPSIVSQRTLIPESNKKSQINLLDRINQEIQQQELAKKVNEIVISSDSKNNMCNINVNTPKSPNSLGNKKLRQSILQIPRNIKFDKSSSCISSLQQNITNDISIINDEFEDSEFPLVIKTNRKRIIESGDSTDMDDIFETCKNGESPIAVTEQNEQIEPATTKLSRKRRRKRKCDFLQSQAKAFGASSDESFGNDSDSDVNFISQYNDSNIVCNEDDVEDDSAIDMQAKYLQSIKSPVKIYGAFHVPLTRNYSNINVYSQIPNNNGDDDNDEDTLGNYKEDSFVVLTSDDDENSENENQTELSLLEKAELILKKQRARHKRKINGNNNCNQNGKVKRRKILVISDTSDED